MALCPTITIGLLFSSLEFLYPKGAILDHLPDLSAARIPPLIFIDLLSLSISGIAKNIANIALFSGILISIGCSIA
nr:hypothetical protein [Flavobacterium celericrescens]